MPWTCCDFKHVLEFPEPLPPNVAGLGDLLLRRTRRGLLPGCGWSRRRGTACAPLCHLPQGPGLTGEGLTGHAHSGCCGLDGPLRHCWWDRNVWPLQKAVWWSLKRLQTSRIIQQFHSWFTNAGTHAHADVRTHSQQPHPLWAKGISPGPPSGERANRV